MSKGHPFTVQSAGHWIVVTVPVDSGAAEVWDNKQISSPLLKTLSVYRKCPPWP